MNEDRRGTPGATSPNAADSSHNSGPNSASSSASISNSSSRAASQVVPVRIAGHEYKIRSSGDSTQLQQIAGYVDRAMKRVRERTGTVDSLDVAVLTCLNLGREILALRERGEGQDAATSVDASQLRSLIERVEAVVTIEPESASPSAAEGQSGAEAEPALARTLELPSVEALRDRNASADAGSVSGEGEGLVESRVAAGGRRDRAS